MADFRLTHESQLPVFLEHLTRIAAPWMIRDAMKATEDSLNPNNQRLDLEIRMGRAWDAFSALFDSGRYAEAAPLYADYLELRSKLNHFNQHG